MKRLVYFLVVTLIANISLSSCQRKAISQEEIDEFSRQINAKLEQIDNKTTSDSNAFINDSSSADSIVKIKTEKENQKAEITIIQHKNDGENFSGVFIVFIAIATPFACAVLIVFFIIRGITSRQREHNKLIEKAIENNYPLPDKFFDAPKRHKSRLQSSLVWLACGIGTMGFFYIVDPTETDSPMHRRR